MSAQAGVGILTSSQLSHCVSDWIPLGSRALYVEAKVLDRSLCLLQIYAPIGQTLLGSFFNFNLNWC